jgi:ABC-type sugar transport system ATPase subunit
VILISSDLSEIVNLSHRIYIISEKNKCIEFDAEDCNENLIQHHFLNSVMEEAKAY